MRFSPARSRASGCQQRDVVAGGAIHLHEVARPEILDPRSIEGEHSGLKSSWNVPNESRRERDCQPPGQRLSVARPLRVLWRIALRSEVTEAGATAGLLRCGGCRAVRGTHREDLP